MDLLETRFFFFFFCPHAVSFYSFLIKFSKLFLNWNTCWCLAATISTRSGVNLHTLEPHTETVTPVGMFEGQGSEDCGGQQPLKRLFLVRLEFSRHSVTTFFFLVPICVFMPRSTVCIQIVFFSLSCSSDS